jgi:DNA ligase-1
MTRFAALFAAIDHTTSTSSKVEAMAGYFADAPAADAAWAVFFLTGRRLKRLISSRAIGGWITAATGLPEWLLGECYGVVGDGAETAALLFDDHAAAPGPQRSLAEWVEGSIQGLRHLEPEAQAAQVLAWLGELPRWERFTLLKLLTGELRVGVSQTLVVRALAQSAGLATHVVAARLMGEWTPSAAWYGELVAADATTADRTRPYPFCLAAPLDPAVRTAADVAAELGDRDAWQVEWKWDGIRAQLIRRDRQVWLWSRGEELITARFPEIAAAAAQLPDGSVLDGEVLAFRDGRPLPFFSLQQRIGRTRDVARAARAVPVVFMAYDLLERDGVDVRRQPLRERRAWLDALLPDPLAGAPTAIALLPDDAAPSEPARPAALDRVLQASGVVAAGSWSDLAERRAQSREMGVEGLMLKHRDSPYGVGRKRGDWWKWKIDPYSVDAVLIYAQPGSGKRASLLTDYTFGLWHDGALVPVAKAYSGLTNDEIAELDRWIRRHTVERFGPVRHVEPLQVFELGFEAIARSARHRSGVAVRFPRMLRWRRDKPAAEADRLDTLVGMLPPA